MTYMQNYTRTMYQLNYQPDIPLLNSRKEFKPTIPARRKKQNVPAAAVEKQEAKREERHFEEPSKAFEQKLKDRISGKEVS